MSEKWYMPIVERNLLPGVVLRLGVRQRVRQGIDELNALTQEEHQRRKHQTLARLRQGPLALHVERANEQHYDLPVGFFRILLGKHLKYSAGYWPHGINALTAAEDAMLRLTAERARLADGQTVLDLGSGWGALSLWVAEHYPNSEVVAVSNSEEQRTHVFTQAQRRGLNNLTVLRADVASFNPGRRFDRILSVEMVEHMRNYDRLMQLLAAWLEPGGRLFVHHFSHRDMPSLFDHTDPDDWMARHFFTGGTMPSHDLLTYFPHGLELEGHWWLDGTHYARTLHAWLIRYDRSREAIKRILRKTYGSEAEAMRWLVRWRLFLFACMETFSTNEGTEYGVTHIVFRKPGDPPRPVGGPLLVRAMRRILGLGGGET